MRIGRYDVTPGGEGYPGRDEFKGHAHLTWDEGGETRETTIYFDRVLPTLDAATQHAVEQIQLRVQNGDL